MDDIRWVTRRCPVCGKWFDTLRDQWGYKRISKGAKRETYYCTWSCLRKAEKAEEQKRKKRSAE